MQVGLHHHRDQALIDPAAALQQRWEERPRAQLGDPQLQVPGDRRQGPRPRAVALIGAVVIATGVAADGRREVLGFEAFLRSLKSRGLNGVQLVISDAHAGLRAAIEAVLIGAAWQRCRVHFLRNLLAQAPKGSAEMVAATIRTVFAQPDSAHVREQLDTIADMLGRQFPFVAHAVNDWCRFNSAASLLIDPGSLWPNVWIESFNGRLRDELLNVWRFDSLLEARVIIED